MIARIWRGAVHPEDTGVNIACIEKAHLRNYRETAEKPGAHIA